MSKYIQKACPARDCNSSDAFTVYEDGSKCFSCGFSSKNIKMDTTVNPKTGAEREYLDRECPNCSHHTTFEVTDGPSWSTVVAYCNHCHAAIHRDGRYQKPLYGKKAEERLDEFKRVSS